MDDFPSLPICPACKTPNKVFVYSVDHNDLVCRSCGDGTLLPPQISTVPATLLNTALFLMVLGLWVFGAWLDGGVA
jgi:hypothetical protein